jgi:acetyl esterase/lipase
MGEPGQDDGFLAGLCKATGVRIYSVDYRLAPENPYPAAFDDICSALQWLGSDGDGAAAVDTARIAVGGTSAGGGLAAATALFARDHSLSTPCFQLLVYPMLDCESYLRTSGAQPPGASWSEADSEFAWRAYLGADTKAGSSAAQYAAAASVADLVGVAPAAIFVGDRDLFAHENVAFAHRLIDARVPVDLRVYSGAFHGFNFAAPQSVVASQFHRDVAEALSFGVSGDENR